MVIFGNRSIVLGYLLLLAIAIVGGCTLPDGRPEAQESIEKFHSMLNAGSYHQIYADADNKLREATSEQQMTRLLRTIHTKLGVVASTKTSHSRTTRFLTGTQVVMIQNTEFEGGFATETFTFSYKNNKASLLSYKIDSNDMSF